MRSIDDVEENERTVREAFDWPLLMQMLAKAADAKAKFQEKNSVAERETRARFLFSHAMKTAAHIVGKDALGAVYQEDYPESVGRADLIVQAVDRLFLAAQAFDVIFLERQHAPSSLASLANEIYAIANGDEPRLLAQFPGERGRPTNAYRLAWLQIKALEWEAYLRAKGDRPSEAQIKVSQAFGETWGTIARWKTQIQRELGNGHLAKALRIAAAGRGYFISPGPNGERADAMLRADAKAYREELRRRGD